MQTRTTRKSTWHPAVKRPPARERLADLLRRQSKWIWKPVMLLAVFTVIPEQAGANGMSPGEAQSGSLLLRMQDGYSVSTLLNTNVDMRINGLVARVTVSQEFRNDGSDWAEGVYVFPLPDEAAVDHMRLYIGDRFIEGEIREKEQARKEYEQAREQGVKASLVEQERPNLFTTSVANIGPGETVVVEIEYLENLRYDNGIFSVRFPLTITPRYMPGSPLPDPQADGWSPDATQVVDATRISPPMITSPTDHQVSMHINLNAGVPLEIVASRYHPVSVAASGERYDVILANGRAPMDRDFELLWRPVPNAAPRAMVFDETIAGDPHFLIMVMPPSSDMGGNFVMPREMIFVIDTSGSMHGTSIEQAKTALQRALAGLSPLDRFNVIEFNSQPRALFPSSVEVDMFSLSRATQFVASLAANGGTEMRSALGLALDSPEMATHLRQVVFITDGAVGNEEELFTLIEDRLGGARLFTVGIGSAPNSWFMRRAAEAGRGTFTTISSLNEVGEKMDRLFAKIEQPQVTSIEIDWPSGVVADMYPPVVPDLYLGEPVVIRAKIEGGLRGGDTVGIRGNSVAGAWSRQLPLESEIDSPGIGALWARARIASLMDDQQRGADADEIRSAIVALALGHHLVSRYTSLVAIDKTPARIAGDLLRRDQVGNRMAHGQDARAIVGFPATATNARQLQLTGLALIATALSLMLVGRRRTERAHVAHT